MELLAASSDQPRKSLSGGAYRYTSSIYQVNFGSQQFQPNATDAVTWTDGRHLFKFGADYRQTTAYYNDGKISRSPYVAYGWTSAATNTASFTAHNQLRLDPTSKNLGLFAQGERRILPRLSLSLWAYGGI
jgi:hypothetical protein